MKMKESSLASALRETTGRLVRHLRSVEPPGGLTWSQSALVGRLDRFGEATAAALAVAEGVRPQSIGATLDMLEKDGLIVRRQDPNDRRQLLVSISEHGREVIRASRKTREKWLADAIADRLTEKERNVLREAVAILARLVEG
jgi:DNA-binding MarR family transcriptional regulator